MGKTINKGIDTKKLKLKMFELDYSQKRLSNEIGMSETSFNAKLNGKAEFDQQEIVRLCKRLHIGPDEIVTIFFPSICEKRKLIEPA